MFLPFNFLYHSLGIVFFVASTDDKKFAFMDFMERDCESIIPGASAVLAGGTSGVPPYFSALAVDAS